MSVSSTGSYQAGDLGGGWDDKPRCDRIFLIASDSSLVATTLICSLQIGKHSIIKLHTRRSKRVQGVKLLFFLVKLSCS